MIRFVALAWNGLDPQGARSAQLIRSRLATSGSPWRLVIDAGGFILFCTGMEKRLAPLRVLDNEAGAIVGSLFERGSGAEYQPASAHFGSSETSLLVSSCGRRLTTEYWGSYVAFVRDSARSTLFVLRGPTGTLKCFSAQFEGVRAFFSRVEDFAALKLFRLTVNWRVLRAQAACSDYIGPETGIAEISYLEGGECAIVSRHGVTRRFYWHPGEIAKEANGDNFFEAARALRYTVQSCTAALTSCHEGLIHRLSGGLDSSIVLSCLAHTPIKSNLLSLNFYSDSATGDERRFARAVANHVGCELREEERSPQTDLRIFDSCARTAWPELDFSGYGMYQTEVRLARERGATGISCGELGDNIFEREVGLDAAADYAWRHGIRTGLMSVAADCALRTNVSIWRVLRHALRGRAGSRPPPLSYWSSYSYMKREMEYSIRDITLMSEEALSEVERTAEDFIHPWFRTVPDFPPAKYLMIYGLMIFPSTEMSFAGTDDPVLVAPLSSQPLAELCLRTPTYLNTRGGAERALAREAFARELPDVILARTGKGNGDSWTRDIIQRNSRFLREYLLDGILIREHILDRQRLEGVLSSDVSGSRVFVADVITQLYIEAWLRRWADFHLEAAA
jgi:asparagine synthase (glutamine-hydrolysing)